MEWTIEQTGENVGKTGLGKYRIEFGLVVTVMIDSVDEAKEKNNTKNEKPHCFCGVFGENTLKSSFDLEYVYAAVKKFFA
jgi:hypothetical protein